MSQLPFDQGIPLLTEVLLGPEVAPAMQAEPVVEATPALPPTLAQPDWDAIEARLT